MATVSVETGSGEGYTAQVNSLGRVLVDVDEIQRVVEPVTTRPEIMEVDSNSPTVSSAGSTEVVAERIGRRWLEIQNIGDFTVHILLDELPAQATSLNRRLDPGEVFSWRNGVSYEGPVQAIAISGNSQIAVMEFYTS